jgi:hypothetical protein
MSRDLTIRLLGRPQVLSDGSTGFRKMSRKYVVQGPRATLSGILDSSNPLFLDVGTPDEEFTEYYLIDQKLSPASDTLDKAYLVREYIEATRIPVTESFSQADGTISIRKKFTVLRTADNTLGYGSRWGKHPSQKTNPNTDAWQYIPEWVESEIPETYTVSGTESTGSWRKGSVSVNQVGEGLDVWSVEYINIKLLGRPEVTTDKQTGFRKIVRKYVVEGPQTTYSSVLDSSNPLFLPVGTADSDFSGFYLVDQKLSKSDEKLDKAYLVQEYLEVTNIPTTENFSQSDGTISIRKKFTVLRTNDAALGYGSRWNKHPSQKTTANTDSWEYIPSWVESEIPETYTVSGTESTGSWKEGSVSVTQLGEGLDVWSVEFINIKLLGRPEVTTDKQTGFRKIARKYVVEGSNATFNGVLNSASPLFLPVGTADSDFTTFYLVEQKLTKPDEKLDKAYLIREYLEVTNIPTTENFSQSNGTVSIRKKFTVLRTNDAALGYGSRWSKHPSQKTSANTDSWEYIPSWVESEIPEVYTVSGTESTGSWKEGSVSVTQLGEGLDVWSVEHINIKLLGRAEVTTDKRTGFNKISRRYVVEGPRATFDGVFGATNPLFLPVGTSDSDFTTYRLTDQKLSRSDEKLDKAYLVREYLEISARAIQEAYTQTNDLIRVRKRFAVLRNDDATIGYGTLWANHPSQATTYAEDPWEYAPAWIKSATPGSKNYTVDNADDGTQHGFADTPQVGSDSLGTFAATHASSGDWMEGYSVMTQAGSGLDVWTVEWVTHAAPYWVLGTGRGGRSRTSSVNVVSFDNTGLFTTESIASSGSVSYTTRSMTYNFFVRASSIPSQLAQIGGGSASVSFSPTVSVDYSVTDSEGRTRHERSLIKNAVWDGSNDFELTDQGGTSRTLGTISGNKMTFDWATEKEPIPDSVGNEQKDSEGNTIIDWVPSKLIDFRGALITAIKGNISWTMTKTSYSWSSSSGTFGQTKTAIAPIFSKGSEKIWKVAITYVGG